MKIRLALKKRDPFMILLDISVMLTMCFIYGNERTDELWLFYSTTLLWGILTILLLLSRLFKRRKIKVFSFITMWHLIFTIWCYITIRWSVLPDKAIENFAFIYKITIVLWLGDIYINNVENGLKKITNYFLIALMYLACKTLFYMRSDEIIGSSTGIHFNNIAQLLSIGVNITFYRAYFLKKRKYFIPFALMMFVVLQTTSRKAFIFMFLGIIIQLLLDKGIENKIKSITVLSIFGGIGLFSIFNIKSLYEKFGARLLEVFKYFGNKTLNTNDISIIERSFYADCAMDLFKKSPIIGNGLMSVYSSLLISNSRYVAYAHNNYLELLASTGIIGLVIYYFAYMIILYKGLRCLKKINPELILWIFVVCSLAIAQIGIVAYYFNFYSIIILISFYNIRKIEKCKNNRKEF